MKNEFFFLLLLSLSSCSPIAEFVQFDPNGNGGTLSPQQEMDLGVGKGDWAMLCRGASRAPSSDAVMAHNYGVCLYRGRGGFAVDRDTGVRYLQLAARMGYAKSREVLTNLGEYVPAPDLVTAQAAPVYIPEGNSNSLTDLANTLIIQQALKESFKPIKIN